MIKPVLLLIIVALVLAVFFGIPRFGKNAKQQEDPVETVNLTPVTKSIEYPQTKEPSPAAGQQAKSFTDADILTVLNKMDTGMIKPGVILGVRLIDAPVTQEWRATKVEDHWFVQTGIPSKAEAAAILDIEYASADSLLNTHDMMATVKDLHSQGYLYASYVNQLAAFSNGILPFAQKYELI